MFNATLVVRFASARPRRCSTGPSTRSAAKLPIKRAVCFDFRHVVAKFIWRLLLYKVTNISRIVRTLIFLHRVILVRNLMKKIVLKAKISI